MSKTSSPTSLLARVMFWADNTDSEQTQRVKALQKIVRLFLITFTEFKKNELSLRSSALTYTVLLSLVPMLAMSTAIVKGLGGGDQLRQAAYTYLETLEASNSPRVTDLDTDNSAAAEDPEESEAQPASLTDHLRSAVDQLFDYVDNTDFATLGTVGVVGILLSIVLVLSHIESAMNAIWKIENGRSIFRKISDYLTLLILIPLSINIAFAASAFLKNPNLSSKMDALVPFEWMQTLLLQALPVFFIALTFYAMYVFFPNTKVKSRPAMLGAILAGILWFTIQNIYISLQVGVANYNAIYGSFATLPLFLVWMYLGWIFILAGAQVAFAVQNIDSFRLVHLAPLPSRQLGAAFDIMETVQSAFKENRIVTIDTLETRLSRYSKYIITEVVSKLTENNLLHTSLKDQRLLPHGPDNNDDRSAIIKAIWGSEAENSKGGIQSLVAIEAAGQR